MPFPPSGRQKGRRQGRGIPPFFRSRPGCPPGGKREGKGIRACLESGHGMPGEGGDVFCKNCPRLPPDPHPPLKKRLSRSVCRSPSLAGEGAGRAVVHIKDGREKRQAGTRQHRPGRCAGEGSALGAGQSGPCGAAGRRSACRVLPGRIRQGAIRGHRDAVPVRAAPAAMRARQNAVCDIL